MEIKDEEKNYKKGVEHRLTIDGVTKPYQAYFVPIEGLYFNNMNGRISTYIEENDANPRAANNVKALFDAGKLDEYNDQIAQFIKDSANDSGASFKKTKEDIRTNGQKIPGVILRDGRIIDGNRRFTCLRELFKETGDTRFAFFECVILDVPETKEQQRSVKLLELNLQFNVDEKKDYNRIDFLVSFYKDTLDQTSPDVIDKKTYCHAAGMKDSEYNENKAIVETMIDYLEWRGNPNAFYILKNEKLDGPIEDVAKKKRKWTEDEWNDRKDTIYYYMTINQTGDRTRDIRKILDSAAKGGILFNDLKETVEQPETSQSLNDAVEALEKKPATPEESKEKQELLSKVQDTLITTYQNGVFNENTQNDANGPKKALDNALGVISGINTLQVENFPEDRKQELRDRIQKIRESLDKLENAADKVS